MGAARRVGLALGSNVGDRLAHLRQGMAELLLRLPQLKILAVAPIYETDPVDCTPDSGAFYNTVMEVEWEGDPRELRRHTEAVEWAQGRPKQRPRNAPRVLDLDLLYAGDWVLRGDAELELPHPRLAERRFVLEPLAAIRPDLVLPGQTRTVAQLLQGLPPEILRQVWDETWLADGQDAV